MNDVSYLRILAVLNEHIDIEYIGDPDFPADQVESLLGIEEAAKRLDAMFTAALATPPKVASDTDAAASEAGEVLDERNLEAQRRTIEACARVVRRIRDEYASRVRQTNGEHNEDADAVAVAAKIEAAVRALRPNAALTTQGGAEG